MYPNSRLPYSSLEFLFRMDLKVMVNLSVLILMNVDLESIDVIKMLLASTNKETLIANVNADSVVMGSIARMLTNVINRIIKDTANDREKYVKILLEPLNASLVVRGQS